PIETSLPCQSLSAGPQLTVGAFLSTMFPETGPAVAKLPTASATGWLPVEAFASSVPAGTLVESEKLASPGLASPEPPSLAVHPIETSVACHVPSAEPQLTSGAFLSTLFPETGPAVAQFCG